VAAFGTHLSSLLEAHAQPWVVKICDRMRALAKGTLQQAPMVRRIHLSFCMTAKFHHSALAKTARPDLSTVLTVFMFAASEGELL